MKKHLFGFVVIFLMAPVVAFSQSTIQCPQDKIQIANNNGVKSGIIQNALSNYANSKYSCTVSGRSAYCLCFQFATFDWKEMVPNLFLNSSTGGKPVYISGLEIDKFNGTLNLSGSQPITLLNSSFKSCANCISINGNAYRIDESVNVECSGRDKNSTGIKLIGQSHQVLSTNITNCTVGLQIGDNIRPGNFIHVGPDNPQDISKTVTAVRNGTAFKVAYGWGNFFKNNSVYENSTGDLIFSNVEGIELAEGANNGLLTPIILNSNNTTYTGDEGESALLYDIACDPNVKVWSTNAALNFKASSAEGEAEIYLTKSDSNNDQQGKEFFQRGDCIFNNQRDSSFQYSVNCRISMDESRERVFAVLLFHHPTYGSSSYSTPFRLNGPCGPNVLSASELDAPGLTAGAEPVAPGGLSGADAGTQVSGGSIGGSAGAVGGGTISEPAAAPPGVPVDDKKKEESGQKMGATTPAGNDTGPAELSGGIGALAAPGGVQAPKCSLDRSQLFTIPSCGTLLMCSLTLGGLLTFRRRKNCRS